MIPKHKLTTKTANNRHWSQKQPGFSRVLMTNGDRELGVSNKMAIFYLTLNPKKVFSL